MKKIFVLVGVMLAMGQSGEAWTAGPCDNQGSQNQAIPQDFASSLQGDEAQTLQLKAQEAGVHLNLATCLNGQVKSGAVSPDALSTKTPPTTNNLKQSIPKSTTSDSNIGSQSNNDTNYFDGNSAKAQQAAAQMVKTQTEMAEIASRSGNSQLKGLEDSKLAIAKITQAQLNQKNIDENKVRMLQQDRNLVNKAEESVLGKKKIDFTKEDASKANYELVRANLMVVATSGNLKKAAEFEYGRLGFLVNQFSGIANQSKKYSDNIKSMKDQSMASAKSEHAEDSANQSNISAKSATEVSKSGEKLTKEEIAKDIKKIKEAYLRDKLKKQLESDLKAMSSGKSLEEAVGNSFDGKIAFDSEGKKTSLLTKNFYEEGSDAFEKNTDTLKPVKPFTLDSPENDRKIASIVDEVRSAAGEFEQSGILEEDSRSLFVRVSSTYRECVARKCVKIN